MIKIPATIEEAGARLARLDGIATATGWERAAIVYAFTHDGKAGRPSKNAGTTAFSFTEMTALGIVGLTHRNTVAHYRDSWKLAIAAGKAVEVSPNDEVEIPDMPWPPNPTVGRTMNDPERRQRILDVALAAGMGAGSKALDIAANPRSLAVAILADPKTAEAAREALDQIVLAELRQEQKPLDDAVKAKRRDVEPEPAPDGNRLHMMVDVRQSVRAAERAVLSASKLSGTLDESEREFVNDAVERLQTAASWLADIAKSSLDDEALHQWLGGQA